MSNELIHPSLSTSFAVEDLFSLTIPYRLGWNNVADSFRPLPQYGSREYNAAKDAFWAIRLYLGEQKETLSDMLWHIGKVDAWRNGEVTKERTIDWEYEGSQDIRAYRDELGILHAEGSQLDEQPDTTVCGRHICYLWTYQPGGFSSEDHHICAKCIEIVEELSNDR